MRSRHLLALIATGATVWTAAHSEMVAGQEYAEVYPVEARVWLDRGSEPVLQRGERARIYYRVSESSFVAIFHIDTNGAVRLVFPSSPQENHYARGGRDYRVLFPGSSYWYVNDDPGVGYFFIVASPEPFDFGEFGYSHYAGGWDLGFIGRQVYGDPYLAMDDFVAALIPDWEYVGYGLDFSSYHVERHYDYPRFLCYDCHGFRPYQSWNPYLFSCTSFRVVIYSDPYYYPATRYRGTRVVYVQPRRGVPRFGFKERGRGEAGTPAVVVRDTPPVSQPGVEGPGNRRAVPRSGIPSVFNPNSSGGASAATPGRVPPGTEGNVNRRTGQAGTQGPGNTERPVIQRRPGEPGSATARPGSTGTTGTPVTRPSTRVRKPGGGGSGTQALPGTGPTVIRNPGKPTTPAAGGSNTPTRTTPTVRSGGTAARSVPTARSGGIPSRATPTARSGGASTRTAPAARSGGSSTPKVPAARSGGATTRATPRTTKPKVVPKVRKPGGGGGG